MHLLVLNIIGKQDNYLIIYYSSSNNILSKLIIVGTNLAQHCIMICISSHIYSSQQCSIDTGSYNVTFIDTVLILHFPTVAPICVYVSPGMYASLLCGHVPLLVLPF